MFSLETTQRNDQVWISRALAVLRAARRGDLEQRILNVDAEGELGELMHAINDLLDITDAFVRESSAALEYASAEKYFRRVLPDGLLGSFRGASRSINSATTKMGEIARALSHSMEQVQREKKAIADRFSSTLSSVTTSVGNCSEQVRTIAAMLAESANESSLRSEAVAATTEETAVTVNAIAAATEELDASVREIAGKASYSAQATRTALKESQQAGTLVSALSQSSSEIDDMVALISDVASQTNLLALNATIEAARAGDAGRGFSVVANEVKALAQQTAVATKQIKRSLTAIKKSSSECVTAMLSIGNTMEKVDSASTLIADVVGQQGQSTREISSNVHQAAIGINEGSRNVQMLSHFNRELSLMAGQLLESAETLVGLVNDMVDTQSSLTRAA